MRAAAVRALVASLLLSSSVAVVCECPRLEFAPGFAAADSVFEGAVESSYDWNSYTVFVIRVTNVFKGDVSSRVLAITRAGCGEYPVAGVPWVFMFHPEARWLGAYELFRCGILSHPRSELTTGELALLGAGYPPQRARSRWVAAAVLLGLIVVAAARPRRRGRK